VNVSNHEHTFIGGYQPAAKIPAKGFLISSNYTANDGEKINYTAAGISFQQQAGTKQKKSIFDQMNFSAREMFGVSQINTPVIDPDGSGTNTRNNLFGGLDLQGHARIDKVTGKLEISAVQNDFRLSQGNFSMPAHDISAGVDYKPNEHLTVGGARHWEVSANDLASQAAKVQTAYDAVDVIYDTRGKDKKVYLVVDSKLYLMEGAQKLSAVGLQEKLKLAIPMRKRGTFTVIGQAEDVVNNRRHDAFYDTPATGGISASWEKLIQKSVKAGASATLATKNRPFYLFENQSQVRPDLGMRDTTNAQVYMQIGWGK
jgi:hypothetical protein